LVRDLSEINLKNEKEIKLLKDQIDVESNSNVDTIKMIINKRNTYQSGEINNTGIVSKL